MEDTIKLFKNYSIKGLTTKLKTVKIPMYCFLNGVFMSAGATSERRKDSRLDSKKVFSHYKVDIHYYTEETSAEMMNISEQGIGLFLKRDILVEVDQSLSLKIVNLSTHYTIAAKARIAWKRRSPNPKEPGYMFGCEFEEPIELPDDIVAINFSIENDD